MSEVLVEVENISKKFCRDLKKSLYYGVQDIARELCGMPMTDTLRKQEFWAVRDVSFSLKRGDALGIIGRNGAGKTTLLKMLNGLIKPNRGTIRMTGHVQALIDLGVGFNPVLTGRENIYINAAVLGIPKKVIDKKFDAIVDFAELGEFIDTPVQSYSSGMKVRLGFSVAINVQPDILLIDEVLAVGDQRFRRKARNAMERLLKSDVALIFISHNIHEVLGITKQTMWLDQGEVLEMGDTSVICAKYLFAAESPDTEPFNDFAYMSKRTGEVKVVATQCVAGDNERHRMVNLKSEQKTFLVELALRSEKTMVENVFHIFTLIMNDGTKIAYVMLNDVLSLKKDESIKRTFLFDMSFLHPSHYSIAYELGTEGGPRLEGIENLLYLSVESNREKQASYKPGTYNVRMIDTGRGAVILPVKMLTPSN
jgi:ABC-type polysaccharide/polyol phosphate transport system ATPase subunit